MSSTGSRTNNQLLGLHKLQEQYKEQRERSWYVMDGMGKGSEGSAGEGGEGARVEGSLGGKALK